MLGCGWVGAARFGKYRQRRATCRRCACYRPRAYETRESRSVRIAVISPVRKPRNRRPDWLLISSNQYAVGSHSADCALLTSFACYCDSICSSARNLLPDHSPSMANELQATRHVIPGQHIRGNHSALRSQSGEVQIAVTQYVPRAQSQPLPEDALTIIGLHANGFPKARITLHVRRQPLRCA